VFYFFFLLKNEHFIQATEGIQIKSLNQASSTRGRFLGKNTAGRLNLKRVLLLHLSTLGCICAGHCFLYIKVLLYTLIKTSTNIRHQQNTKKAMKENTKYNRQGYATFHASQWV
jgi:hypothetical protein